MRVPKIVDFYSKEIVYTIDLCTPVRIEGMPDGLDIWMLEPDLIQVHSSDGFTFAIGFKNGGSFLTTTKNGPREYILENPPTPIYIHFNNQEVFAVPTIGKKTRKVMRASTNKYGIYPIQ